MPGGFWTEVEKITLGGTFEWTAWIEDTATGQVVSGRPPTARTVTTAAEQP